MDENKDETLDNKPTENQGRKEPIEQIPMVEEGTKVISESLGGVGMKGPDGKLVFILENPSMNGTELPKNGQYAVVFVNKEIEPEEEEKGGAGIGVPIGVPIGGKGNGPLTEEEKDQITDHLSENAEEQDEQKKDKKGLIFGIALVGLGLLTAAGLLRGCQREPEPVPDDPRPAYVVEYKTENTKAVEEFIQTQNPGMTEHHVSQAVGQEQLIGEKNGHHIYDWQKQASSEQTAIDTYEQIQEIDSQIYDAFEVLKSDEATAEEKAEAWSKLEQLNARKLQITNDSKEEILQGVEGFEEASRKTEDERTDEEIALLQSTMEDYERMKASLEANSEMFQRVNELNQQGYSFDIEVVDRPDGDRFLTLDGERTVKITKDEKTGELLLEEVETPENMFKDGEGRNE